MSHKNKNRDKGGTSSAQSAMSSLETAQVSSKIAVDGKLASEASAVNDVHVNDVETFMSALRRLLTAQRHALGVSIPDKACLEVKPYELIFKACTMSNLQLDAWGTKKNMERSDFPKTGHVLNGNEIYRKVTKLRLDVLGGYVHYVENKFHFFVKEEKMEYFPKEKEIDMLKNMKGVEAIPPETSKPETSKPETSKPETSKPETSKPETS